MEFNTDILSQFNKKWALISAGNKDNHNTMTISWGGMGTLWGKDTVTVYVKPCRYTYKFMNENEYFTVSFYPEKYREALTVMGTLSGRDVNKDEKSGLTLKNLGVAVTYREVEVTLLCKKIYSLDFKRENMPEEVIKRHYSNEEPHRMFVGEIVEIIKEN